MLNSTADILSKICFVKLLKLHICASIFLNDVTTVIMTVIGDRSRTS